MILRSIYLLLFVLLASTAYGQSDDRPNNADSSLYGYKVSVASENYEWVELSAGTGATLLEPGALTDDNFFGPVNLGFSFPYFWNEYNSLYIGSNGYLMFGTPINVASQATGFPQFPGGVTLPNNYLSAYLADLTFSDVDGDPVPNARCMFQTINNRFIVTFENVPFWVREIEAVGAFRGSNTFQMILDGTDRSIKFAYKNCSGPASQSYMGAGMNFATRGIENNTGNNGINFPPNEYPINGEVYYITYQPNTAFSVRDVSVDWLFNDNNQGLAVIAGGEQFQSPAKITNSGTVRISNIPVTRSVSVLIQGGGTDNPADYTEVLNIASMEPGESKIMEFSLPLRFNDQNMYRVSVSTNMTADAITANNSRTARVTVFDTTARNLNLTSAGEIPVGYDGYGVFSQLGRNLWDASIQPPATAGPVGMFLQPPFYPAVITALEYGIVIVNNRNAPDTILGFNSEIYNEDENGLPGTLLQTLDVKPADIQYNEQTSEDPNFSQLIRVRVNLPTEIKLENNQGLFVSYERKNPPSGERDISSDVLAIDQSENFSNYPSSSRSYEITGGHWAPNRNQTTVDFPIRMFIKVGPTSRGDSKNAPVQIGGIYPNPANESMEMQYTLPESGNVHLSVMDAQGRVIETRNLGRKLNGQHTENVDTRSYADGIYLVSLRTDGYSTSTKVVVGH